MNNNAFTLRLVVVTDDDGAVLIPAALPGLYPPNAENKARYLAQMAGS